MCDTAFAAALVSLAELVLRKLPLAHRLAAARAERHDRRVLCNLMKWIGKVSRDHMNRGSPRDTLLGTPILILYETIHDDCMMRFF